MSQNDIVTEARSVSSSPQSQGESEDLETQDIKCRTCGKTFSRLDHLRRHERGHSAEKPFACGECQRRFARLDVLKRHQSSHEMSRKGDAADGLRRHARACLACASARVKCLGGTVCHRCRSRSLQCEYPSKRNYSQTISRLDSRDETITLEKDHDSSMAASSFENRSSSEVSEGIPKESMWSNQLVEVLNYNPSSVGRSHDVNGSGVTSAAASSTPQQALPKKSAMNVEDQSLSKGVIEPDQTIIPGACLIPHVSEVNIGSIYNYSRINWLPPNNISQISRDPSVLLLQSPESVSVESQYAFPSETQNQPLQQEIRQNSLTSNHSNASSPTLVVEAPFEAPMYYVDGDGARLPMPARQRQQSRSLFGSQNTTALNHNPHDNLRPFDIHSNPDNQLVIWDSDSYITLTHYLQHISRRHIAMPRVDSLPSLEELNVFARLYFDRFHESFPLLHRGTFLDSRDGCLLELAISAIGACYMRTRYARKCSEFLHELVHELLKIASENIEREFPRIFGLRQSEYPQRPTHLQTRILNVLGMFHSGNPRLASFAREDRANMVTTCIESKILMSNHYNYLQGAHGIEKEGDQILQQWIEGELKCRAGYFVWMLDCMIAYESDFRTHMNLSDGKAPLPCPEQIWDKTVPPMSQLLILNSGPPSLCSALNMLYTEKILVPNLGELSRILLIHGMYRRVWEVARYHSDRLSDWVPTSLGEPNHANTSERTTRPWSNSVVSRWINGSCDCLDVLHWSAYTTILQASGFEHPTVLHLHFSRLVLLAPVSDLQEFAKAKFQQESQSQSNSYLYPTSQDQGYPKSLVDWVVHDQYKARLAIIHAGSVFWHLRRYGCGAVLEPFAKYLATLVIWAYSVSILAAKSALSDGRIPRISEASHPNQDRTMQLRHTTSDNNGNSDNHNHSSPENQISGGLEQLGSHGTSLIQLDRPCDDELVQLFVRFGEQVTPYMAQIGDIKCRESPGKILREGIKLLSSHDNHATNRRDEREGSFGFIWGAAENFIAMLSALATTSQVNSVS